MHPLIGPFTPPVLDLGPIEIHAFGVLVMLGFIFGGGLAAKKAARFGGDAEAINRIISWLVLGVVVGGHLGHLLFYEPQELLRNPMVIFNVLSGLSSYGGFIACVGITIWFFRKEKLDWWRHADALAIGLTLGWFFGRLGCFSAHDHAGNPTNFWLGVYGMCPGGDPTVACHDLGLYEAIWSFGMFVAFMLLDRRPRFPGFYVGWLAAIYGPSRLVMDAFRNLDGDTRYLGFTPAQYFSVVFTLLGAWMLKTQWKKAPTWKM